MPGLNCARVCWAMMEVNLLFDLGEGISFHSPDLVDDHEVFAIPCVVYRVRAMQSER